MQPACHIHFVLNHEKIHAAAGANNISGTTAKFDAPLLEEDEDPPLYPELEAAVVLAAEADPVVVLLPVAEAVPDAELELELSSSSSTLATRAPPDT